MKRLLVASAMLLPGAAWAHHPMGGMAPASMGEGIASGLAHPVLGLDHLAFLLAAGLMLSAAPRLGLRALAGFIPAMLLGALIHRLGVGLGPVEAMVALSVLAAGAALLVFGRALPASWLVVPAFAVAGLFHGHALAEAGIGSPVAVFAAYLAALAAMQATLALAAMAAARLIPRQAPFRAAGLAAMAVGAVALVFA